TYPSYALNLAQLGALCISNLCATKPSLSSLPIFIIWVIYTHCAYHHIHQQRIGNEHNHSS
ncbi:MAG: hypothetical protein ACN6NV_14010, partial [Acinetobacter gandensis]|uniref:hypothetical protein n=1 Tax=Acinetobacter gandensis TaxID=1443941 RepID=UPI003D07E640